MVDSTVRARAVGIDTQYKNLRGGAVRFLPQRIAVIAQGATASAGYSTTKFQAESAKQVGMLAGFRSPAYADVKQLLPPNGDGVGAIPVDVLLLNDADGSTASAGAIAPSGTATKAKTYYVRGGGVLSAGFSVPVGAVDLTRDLRSMGQAIQAVPDFPMVVGWTYDTITEDHTGNTGTGTLDTMSATTTTCVPGDWTLVCTAASTDAGTFTLTDPNGTIVAEDVVASAGGSVFNEGGLQGTLTDATTDFAVGDTFTITVPALTMTLTSAWKGISANDIELEVIDDLGDLTWTITQPTGGTVNPTVDAALAQIGDSWVTMVVNALNNEDTTALNTYSAWGEGRWGELVKKPAVVFTGCNDASVGQATVITTARGTDRTNSQLTAPACPNMPHVIAAREVARIAAVANRNPAHDYCLQRATGLVPWLDSESWTHPQRDTAVKAGASTSELRNSVICVSDVVTMYDDGDDTPAYRWVVNIVKLQNIIYNLDQLFDSEEWAGKPLIPDGQLSEDPDARTPSAAKAAVAALVDNLAAKSIVSDPDTIKESIDADINGSNPRMLDVSLTVTLSGNVGIVSIPLSFGFYFG